MDALILCYAFLAMCVVFVFVGVATCELNSWPFALSTFFMGASYIAYCIYANKIIVG